MGRGTFVVQRTEDVPRPALKSSVLPMLAQDRTQRRLGELMRLTEQADLLSFAQAIPAPDGYPASSFNASFQHALQSTDAMGYGPIQGDLDLRTQVSELLGTRGLSTTPDDILINGGAQQAIYLALQAFCRPHDTILVEEPTYSGVIELASQRGQRVVSVPMDADGIDLEALDQLCAQVRPRILYTVPTFHNPTGISLAESRRKPLLALADKWDLLILEDDVYGWLSYDGPAPLPLKADDDKERVLYIGSFSKVLFPALRLGAVVAAQPLLVELVAIKESCDLVSSLLMQRTLADWIRRRNFPAHLERVTAMYRERRDAMVEALTRAMSPRSFLVPGGGFNVWINLPSGTSESELFLESVENGVGVARGSQFYYQPTPGAHLRLSFAAQPPHRIREGVARLGRLLDAHLVRRRSALARASREASPLV